MMASTRIVALLAAAILAGSTGCVTQGSYNELESNYRTMKAERDSLAEYTAALEKRMEDLSAARDELSEQLVLTEVEVAVLRGTYDELVGELESEVASGQIVIEQMRDGIRLNVSQEILFPSGSAELDERGRDVISRVSQQVKDESGVIITVEGHSDNVRISSSLAKRYPTNWELAGARAASVVRLMSENGVDPIILRAVSRGPFAPVDSNDTREGRAKNRRIEILLRPIRG